MRHALIETQADDSVEEDLEAEVLPGQMTFDDVI